MQWLSLETTATMQQLSNLDLALNIVWQIARLSGGSRREAPANADNPVMRCKGKKYPRAVMTMTARKISISQCKNLNAKSGRAENNTSLCVL